MRNQRKSPIPLNAKYRRLIGVYLIALLHSQAPALANDIETSPIARSSELATDCNFGAVTIARRGCPAPDDVNTKEDYAEICDRENPYLERKIRNVGCQMARHVQDPFAEKLFFSTDASEASLSFFPDRTHRNDTRNTPRVPVEMGQIVCRNDGGAEIVLLLDDKKVNPAKGQAETFSSADPHHSLTAPLSFSRQEMGGKMATIIDAGADILPIIDPLSEGGTVSFVITSDTSHEKPIDLSFSQAFLNGRSGRLAAARMAEACRTYVSQPAH
ncbi:hypothetical protein [Jiella sp. M17.18]|uniref:hypothetical protein n=1 Tax=Jiella sp. M17.18 TaxID=3234247 RepID=UPI0034DFD189